ncbi:hypothetical protein H3U10_19835 [Clostridioides difficile]|nr:hypothetical protein [Clostridioides difficile]
MTGSPTSLSSSFDLSVADWFLRLHGYATSVLLIGITIFTTTNIFATSVGQYYLYIGRLVSMPTASTAINGQLYYNRRTSYMLRGLLAQIQVLYLQFGLAPDTCNMNS